MNRLTVRLATAFGAVILLTLLALSLTLLALLRHDPLTQRLTVLQLSAQAQGTEILLRRNPEFRPTTEEGQAALRDLAQRQHRRLLWIDEEGTVRFDSSGEWEGKEVNALLTRRLPITGQRGHWWGEQKTENGTWLFAALPTTMGGYLAVGKLTPPLAFWRRFRSTLLEPLLQAGALAMVLSGVLALLISRSIVLPLQQLIAATQALAEGDLGARAPEDRGPLEIRQLARTFNTMGARLQATQEAERAFLANVAHDLRTPLTSIQGFAQALLDGTAASEESRQQAAQAIYEEARRLERLTTALLDLARLEAGAMQMEKLLLDLGKLAERRTERFRPRAEQAGLSLRCTHPSTPLLVIGDENRLAQAIDNLLDNALRYTPPGGSVVVRLEATPTEILLTVADTGDGIPPEAIPHLFERFYRADPARGGAGAGLGLAIVQQIVRAHGGRISVESRPGQGSRFTLHLPRAEGEAAGSFA